MTDLSEVYEGGRTVVNPQQRLLGMTIFAVGAVLVVGAIPIATTDLSSWFGLDLYGARQAAGVLAGLGVPAVFVGIFVVLPASNTTRAATAIGASLTVFGVALFSYAYPSRWLSNDPQFALGTIALYLAGALVTFWCLFVAVATFKTRDDPGGTARVEITEEGKIRVINPSDGGNRLFPGLAALACLATTPTGQSQHRPTTTHSPRRPRRTIPSSWRNRRVTVVPQPPRTQQSRTRSPNPHRPAVSRTHTVATAPTSSTSASTTSTFLTVATTRT
ncbi:DUF7139 domain-containing protein [Halovenus salina]|uniref:Cell division protein A N-terminal domain-containing protein n=1 Tax=Halovenus salina TaxID=1510225 RepID=A0ABD5W356_9EURY